MWIALPSLRSAVFTRSFPEIGFEPRGEKDNFDAECRDGVDGPNDTLVIKVRVALDVARPVGRPFGNLAAQERGEIGAINDLRANLDAANRSSIVLSRKAEELGQISAAARCEELIGKHRGMFTDRAAFEWDFDPSKLSTEQLEGLAHQWILQATGNDPVLADPVLAEATLVEMR